MKMRIAILAASVGTLMLTGTLAHAGEPIPGVDVNLDCRHVVCKTEKASAGKTARQTKQQPKTKSGAPSTDIFDRWGNSRK